MVRNYIKKNKTKFILFFICFLLISFYFVYFISSQPSSTGQQSQTVKHITQNGQYSLSYPSGYKYEANQDESGINLEKDSKWDLDQYKLLKGSSITVIQHKDGSFFEGNKVKRNKLIYQNLNDNKVQDKNINGLTAIEVTAGYDHPLRVPRLRTIYIIYDKKILEFTQSVGENIDQKQYEEYLSDFNEIVGSVKFQN